MDVQARGIMPIRHAEMDAQERFHILTPRILALLYEVLYCLTLLPDGDGSLVVPTHKVRDDFLFSSPGHPEDLPRVWQVGFQPFVHLWRGAPCS